jgi:hypothetical protein
MATRLKIDPQKMAHCIHNIPCECGRRYIGETGGSMNIGPLEKSKLDQQSYEESHKAGCTKIRILETESNSR